MRRSLILAALSLGECTDDVAQVEDVEDLRVLAVRAEPPEFLIPTAEADNLESLEFDVTFDVLAVDPRGGTVELQWQFCPVESTEACRDYEEIRDESPDFAESLDAMRSIQFQESDVAPFDVSRDLDESLASQRDVWPFDTSGFVVEAPADLAVYHGQVNFFGLGSGSWPSAQVRASANGNTVLASKRVVIGLDDYSAFSDVFEDEFGFTVCGENPSEDPGCLELRPGATNTNPVFDRIEIAFSDQANAPFEVIPQRSDGAYIVPPLEPNEEVRILPVMTENSFEDYQRLETNVDTQVLQVEDVTEEISIAWYISGGEVQDTFTWPLFTRTLDTVFTAPSPPETPASGRVSMWLVAQDQRGGTAWAQLDIPILPGATGSR